MFFYFSLKNKDNTNKSQLDMIAYWYGLIAAVSMFAVGFALICKKILALRVNGYSLPSSSTPNLEMLPI